MFLTKNIVLKINHQLILIAIDTINPKIIRKIILITVTIAVIIVVY